MLSAIAAMKVQEYHLTERMHWALTRKIAICASMVCLIWFFVFELFQQSKFTYNAWHPYISPLPVLAFVVLRNATPVLRSTYSSVFAFIGRCSLETFIIQFHLWLAGDTKGVLLVIPGTSWRPVNFILSTVMFIFISDQMARATTVLTGWICGSSSKTSLPVTNTLPNSNLGLSSLSTRRDLEAGVVSEAANRESIPLTTTETPKDTESTTEMPSERDGSQRWIDRLAGGSSRGRNTLNFQEWYGKNDSQRVKMIFFAGFGIMWTLNILW